MIKKLMKLLNEFENKNKTCLNEKFTLNFKQFRHNSYKHYNIQSIPNPYIQTESKIF